MNGFIGILVGLLLTTAQSNQAAEQATVQKQIQQNDYSHVLGTTIDINDPYCKTPQLHPDQTAEIIRQTQTMDLNFVALADAEAGLYNLSKKKVSANSNSYYRGIFQVNDQFHKMDDYCNPAEQVRWLEKKINEGAKPKNLFPSLYQKLYE